MLFLKKLLSFIRPMPAALFLFLVAGPLLADEFDIDMALLDQLNEIEMYEYSRLQVSLMEARYPDRADKILLEKARTLYLTGKSKDADAAVQAIKPGSPVYNDALLLVGEMSARRNQLDRAAQVYAEFFKKVKTPTENDDNDTIETFKRAIAVYSHVLKQQGNAKEASRIIGLLGQLGGKEGASDRQMVFLKAQAVLDAEEEKLNDRKPIDRKMVDTALKQLRELQFVRDGVGAEAYVESARADIVLGGDKLNELKQAKKDAEVAKLGDFLKAIKTLNMAAEFLEDIEKTAIKGNDKSSSPLAGAMFYKGRALWGQAFVVLSAGDSDKARKLVEAAAKYFETVAVDYGDSSYRMKALNEHGKCAAFMEKQFDEKIELTQANTEAELDLKLEQAGAMLQNQNYAAAADIYLEAVRVGRRSKRLPEVAMRLVVCYGNLQRFLEAEALASYLIDVMPNAEGTAECLFRLGAVIYEHAKTEKVSANREALMLRAMDAWEEFVDLAPAHPKAAEVSFVIAEHYYKLASDKASAANSIANAADREAAKQEARECYLQAAPKYQRLVDRYATYEKGIRALYKLGWIYYSTDQPKEAIDAFLRYCETETLPKYNDDRLEAKFRAAEQMMLSDSPREAVEQFRELLTWLTPNNEKGFDAKTKTAQRIQEDAACYYAWSFDLAAEGFRPQLMAFKTEIGNQETLIKETDKRIAGNEERLAGLEKLRAETDAEFQELEQTYGKVDLDFSGRALAQARGQGEDMSKMSAEEKAVAEGNLQIQAQKLEAELIKNVKESARGEALAREAEREEIKGRKETVGGRIETLAQTLAEAEAKEAEALEKKGKTETELRVLRDALSAAEAAVVSAEAETKELADQLERIKEYEDRAQTERQKEAVAAKRKEIENALQQVQKNLSEAHEKRTAIVTPENEAKKQQLETALAAAGTNADQCSLRCQQVKQEKAVAEKEGELLQARLVAAAKALDFNQEFSKVIDRPAQERASFAADLQKQGLGVLEAFRKVRDLHVEKIVMQQNSARNGIAIDRERIEKAKAAIAATSDRMAPLKEEFSQWKRKAEQHFSEFLETHPKSRHTADNMSRLGTIYLELEEFDKAAATLKTLAATYPDSAAAKLALFNLGRAQAEDGKLKEAADTFAGLLAKAPDVPSPNLIYISERLMEAGFPAVALQACEEIIRRSGSPENPEYEALRERARENALFRAGRAARLTGKVDDALKYFGMLLKENPNSGYFYEAKFEMALAERSKQPPDLDGAVRDLSEILQYSNDQVISNRALARLGETLAMGVDKEDAEKAAARLQQVVMLADLSEPGNRPWVELAVAESAKVFARLGDEVQLNRMVAMYRKEFPDGSYAKELNALSAGRPPAAVSTDVPGQE